MYASGYRGYCRTEAREPLVLFFQHWLERVLPLEPES